MKKITKYSLLLFILSAISVFAQEEDMMAAEMKAWEEFMKPGWQHEILAKQAGSWKTKVTSYMNPESPEVSEGTAEGKMILGGRYVQILHEGVAYGQETTGISIDAYDNSKKKFYNTWIDDMGTGIAFSTGDYDKDTKTLTYVGKMTNPMTGGDYEFKQVLKFVDDNHIHFEMFMIMNGQDVKSMEIEYTK